MYTKSFQDRKVINGDRRQFQTHPSNRYRDLSDNNCFFFILYRLFLIHWNNLIRMHFPWPSLNPDCIISIKSRLILKFKSKNWIHSFMFIKYRIMVSPSKPYMYEGWQSELGITHICVKKCKVLFLPRILSKNSFDWISAFKTSVVIALTII